MATDNLSTVNGGTAFDPYYRWLGIPPAEQPPTYYRLLGLVPFESDAEVIALAAERQISHIRRFQGGPQSTESQKLLNELAAAELCLTNPSKKAQYDVGLRSLVVPAPAMTASPMTRPPPSLPGLPPTGPVLPPGAYPRPPVRTAPPTYAYPESPGYPPASYFPPVYAPAASASPGPQFSVGPQYPTGPQMQPPSSVNLALPQCPPVNGVPSTGSPPRSKTALLLSNQQLLIGAAVAAVLIVVVVFSARSWFDQVPSNANTKQVVRDPATPPESLLGKQPVKPADPSTTKQPVESSPPEIKKPPTPAIMKLPPTVENPVTTPVEPLVTPPEVKPPTPGPTKFAIPSEAEQSAARILFDDAWGSEIVAAKTDDAKAAMLEKLLATMDADGDDAAKKKPAERYVILGQARQLAVASGRLRAGLSVVQRVTTEFDLPVEEARAALVQEIGKRTLSNEGTREVAELSLSVAEELIAAKKYDPANQLLNLGGNAAKKAGQNDLVKLVTQRVKDLQDFRERATRFEQAQATLATQPDDPVANRMVGDYLCLEERDWEKGLTYLAKADDESLKELAKHEQMPPESADDQIELGDRWWDCKVGAEGETPSPYRVRALHWYRTALVAATGLSKLKLEQRVRELQKSGPGSAPPIFRGAMTATEAKELQRRWAQFLKTTPTRNALGGTLVLIPPGEFLMGSPSGDSTAAADERPPHTVNITRAYYIASAEVSVNQFQQFVTAASYKTDAENGRGRGFYPKQDGEQERILRDSVREWDQKQRKPGGGPGRPDTRSALNWKTLPFTQAAAAPVVYVSLNDAVAFCAWLSQRDKLKYRLPTEAEWEFACRAGTNTPFCGLDKPEELHKIANVADASLRRQFNGLTGALKASDTYTYTAPTGRLAVNTFGLYDMHGNAAEWCSDRYDETYYGKSVPENPQGPAQGDGHVIRGGSWAEYAAGCRSAARAHANASDHAIHVGFRIVCEP